MSDGLSIVRSYFNMFLHTVQAKHPKRYSYTNAYIWARSMVMAFSPESEEDKAKTKKWIDDLEGIYNNCHKRCSVSIAVVEMILNKNLEEKSISSKVDINGDAQRILDLNTYINEALVKIIEIVTEVAKHYSLDMPIAMSGGMGVKSNEQDWNSLLEEKPEDD